MRRRLHVGFSRAMRTITSTTAGSSGGRPAQRDRRAQKRTKPRRCRPITVSGFTTTRASAHRDLARESTTQNARSTGRRRGRGAARCKTASCWRRARFSATSCLVRARDRLGAQGDRAASDGTYGTYGAVRIRQDLLDETPEERAGKHRVATHARAASWASRVDERKRRRSAARSTSRRPISSIATSPSTVLTSSGSPTSRTCRRGRAACTSPSTSMRGAAGVVGFCQSRLPSSHARHRSTLLARR
jgi:hypothetical protein